MTDLKNAVKIVSILSILCLAAGWLYAADVVIYNDNTNRILGTWTGQNGAGVIQDMTTGGYEGTHCKRYTYNLGTSYWDGMGLNLTNWQEANFIDVSQCNIIHMAYKGMAGCYNGDFYLSSAYHGMSAHAQFPAPVDTNTWTIVNLPMTSFATSAFNPAQLYEIDINLSGPQNQAGSLYFDDLRFTTGTIAVDNPVPNVSDKSGIISAKTNGNITISAYDLKGVCIMSRMATVRAGETIASSGKMIAANIPAGRPRCIYSRLRY